MAKQPQPQQTPPTDDECDAFEAKLEAAKAQHQSAPAGKPGTAPGFDWSAIVEEALEMFRRLRNRP